MSELAITNCYQGVIVDFPDGSVYKKVFCGSYTDESGTRGGLVAINRHTAWYRVRTTKGREPCGLCCERSCTHYSRHPFLNVL